MLKPVMKRCQRIASPRAPIQASSSSASKSPNRSTASPTSNADPQSISLPPKNHKIYPARPHSASFSVRISPLSSNTAMAEMQEQPIP
jgi:cell division septation protein DedD